MSDPTAPVLIASFVAAFVVFPAGSVWKRFKRKRGSLPVVPQNLVETPAGGDETIYAPPVLPPPLPEVGVSTSFYQPRDLLGIGVVFLIYLSLTVLSLHSVEDLSVEKITAAGLAVSIGFQFFSAGLIACLVLPRVGLVEWLGLRWSAWPRVFWIAPATVFAMWMVFAGIQLGGYMQWIEKLGVEPVQDTVKLLQEAKDPLILGLMAFAAVIAAPVCEEIVFRGYFYPVAKKFAGPWVAGFCSALVFAAAHGSLAALLPLFLFGLVLCFLYEKTGSIWAPIAVHFCFNGATVAIQLLARYFNIPLDPPQ